VGAKLHGDRRDPGSHGGPRRLSTPKLPDSDQIRLVSAIHGAQRSRQPTRTRPRQLAGGHAESQAGNAGRWPAPRHSEYVLHGSPHPTWRGVGVWCGQVGASQPPQGFRDVVIFCPRACGVFHIVRGERWGFAVDNPVRAMRCKGFQRWSESVHVAFGVGVRVAGQRPALPGSGFSTWGVESGGCLLWTSGSEAPVARVSGRDQIITTMCLPAANLSQSGTPSRLCCVPPYQWRAPRAQRQSPHRRCRCRHHRRLCSVAPDARGCSRHGAGAQRHCVERSDRQLVRLGRYGQHAAGRLTVAFCDDPRRLARIRSADESAGAITDRSARCAR